MNFEFSQSTITIDDSTIQKPTEQKKETRIPFYKQEGKKQQEEKYQKHKTHHHHHKKKEESNLEKEKKDEKSTKKLIKIPKKLPELIDKDQAFIIHNPSPVNKQNEFKEFDKILNKIEENEFDRENFLLNNKKIEKKTKVTAQKQTHIVSNNPIFTESNKQKGNLMGQLKNSVDKIKFKKLRLSKKQRILQEGQNTLASFMSKEDRKNLFKINEVSEKQNPNLKLSSEQLKNKDKNNKLETKHNNEQLPIIYENRQETKGLKQKNQLKKNENKELKSKKISNNDDIVEKKRRKKRVGKCKKAIYLYRFQKKKYIIENILDIKEDQKEKLKNDEKEGINETEEIRKSINLNPTPSINLSSGISEKKIYNDEINNLIEKKTPVQQINQNFQNQYQFNQNQYIPINYGVQNNNFQQFNQNNIGLNYYNNFPQPTMYQPNYYFYPAQFNNNMQFNNPCFYPQPYNNLYYHNNYNNCNVTDNHNKFSQYYNNNAAIPSNNEFFDPLSKKRNRNEKQTNNFKKNYTNKNQSVITNDGIFIFEKSLNQSNSNKTQDDEILKKSILESYKLDVDISKLKGEEFNNYLKQNKDLKRISIKNLEKISVNDSLVKNYIQNFEGLQPNSNYKKKFIREYVDQILSPEFDKVFSDFIVKLREIYFKKKQTQPLKAKKRFIVGMREVEKYIKLNETKLVFIVPNIEKVEGENSLDDRLLKIITYCRTKEIPFFFGLNKFKLGSLSRKKFSSVSILSIVNIESLDQEFKNIVSFGLKFKEKFYENFATQRDKFVTNPFIPQELFTKYINTDVGKLKDQINQ